MTNETAGRHEDPPTRNAQPHLTAMTPTATLQDLIDFVNAQPDDRPVAMSENQSDAACGCMLVHFIRDRLHVSHDFGVGYVRYTDKESDWNEIGLFPENAAQYIMRCIDYANEHRIQTYGRLKQWFAANEPCLLPQ